MPRTKCLVKIGNSKHLKKERPDILIGVCGCMSQEESVVNKILKIVSKCRYAYLVTIIFIIYQKF